LQIAEAGGIALEKVSQKAFDDRADPATGAKWADKADGSPATLYRGGALRRSIISNAFPDGSVILGSNLVYAGIHQEGGTTKAHEIKARNKKALSFNGIVRKSVKHPGSKIPARPFMGVPRDFERQFFDDPAIQKALGIAGGGS
jgi:phage gpG-like protein